MKRKSRALKVWVEMHAQPDSLETENSMERARTALLAALGGHVELTGQVCDSAGQLSRLPTGDKAAQSVELSFTQTPCVLHTNPLCPSHRPHENPLAMELAIGVHSTPTSFLIVMVIANPWPAVQQQDTGCTKHAAMHRPVHSKPCNVCRQVR